jgi:hypothetical protein
MVDIRQEIQSYEQSHKSQVKWFIGIVIAVILILIFIHFYGPSTKVMFADDKTTKTLQDSMKVHDRKNVIMIQQLETRIQQDSIRWTNTEYKVNKVSEMINAITKKYDKIHKSVAAMSDDEQLHFFTNWISQTDSL